MKIDVRSWVPDRFVWNNKPLKKAISAFVLVAFLFNIALPELSWAVKTAPELTHVGSDKVDSPGVFKRLDIDSFALAANLGYVKDSFNAGGDRVVIHIQDAHCNYACQTKISDIVSSLNRDYGTGLVNLEGGSQSYDLSVFTRINDLKIREQVADGFVREGLINGAEYFAISNPEKMTLWGIEDPALYLENLKIYRDSLEHKTEIERHLKTLNYILSNLKTRIYSKPLFELDLQYSAYKAGNLEFKDYIAYLINKAAEKSISLESFKNVSLLHQSLEQEKLIDFKRANRERDDLLDRLQKALSKKDLETIILKTVEYKAEQISQDAFYSYLISKAKDADIDPSYFPEMQKFIKYVSLYHAIDKLKMMGELDAFEAKIRESMYDNDTQRKLSTLSKNLALLRNIFNITLTKDDFRYYQENVDSFAMSSYISFISEQAPRYNITAQLDKDVTNLDRYREDITGFYTYSLKRDDAFLKNMKFAGQGSGAGEGQQQVAVIVTGGFHTENLCELFKKNKISYISIIPNFRNDEGYESPYFSLLAGEIAALQKRLYSVLTAAATMQIASMLSPLGEAVWGRSNVDTFKAAAIVREYEARNATKLVSVDTDKKELVFRTATGAEERMPATTLVSLYNTAYRTTPMAAAAEAGQIKDVAKLDNYLNNIGAFLKAAGMPAEILVQVEMLRGRNAQGEALVRFIGDRTLPFDGHVGRRGIRINMALEGNDAAVQSALVHEIISAYCGDHNIASSLERAFTASLDGESAPKDLLANAAPYRNEQGQVVPLWKRLADLEQRAKAGDENAKRQMEQIERDTAIGEAAAPTPEARFSAELQVLEKDIISNLIFKAKAGQKTVREMLAEDVSMFGQAATSAQLSDMLATQMEQRMDDSLARLIARDAKFTAMRETRKRSIQDAIEVLKLDYVQIANLPEIKDAPNALERQKQAAKLMMSILHMLLLQDEADLTLPYVPHSIKHSLNVRKEVGKVVAVSTAARDALMATYKAKGESLAYLSAWLHDLGYSALTPAIDAAKSLNAKKEYDFPGYKAGKGYHSRLGVLIAQTPLLEADDSILKQMDNIFGLSSTPSTVEPGRNQLDDIAIMIRDHGADKEDYKDKGGLVGTGLEKYRTANVENDPLNFLVRLADNLDVDMEDRLYSHHTNPFFLNLLRELELNSTNVAEIKQRFLDNAPYYKQFYTEYLIATKNLSKGVADEQAENDFNFIAENISKFDETNFPHFGGMVDNHEFRIENGKLVVIVNLNTENRLIPQKYLDYQTERLVQACKSLGFGGSDIVIKTGAGKQLRDTFRELKQRNITTALSNILRPLADVNKQLEGDPQNAALQEERTRLLDEYELLRAIGEYDIKNPLEGILSAQETVRKDSPLIQQAAFPGDDAFESGQPQYIYVLLSGGVQISKKNEKGESVPIRRINRPTVIGEMAVMTGGARTADVMTTSDATVIKLTPEQFKRLFSYPHFVVAYARTFMARDREQKIEMAKKTAQALPAATPAPAAPIPAAPIPGAAVPTAPAAAAPQAAATAPTTAPAPTPAPAAVPSMVRLAEEHGGVLQGDLSRDMILKFLSPSVVQDIEKETKHTIMTEGDIVTATFMAAGEHARALRLGILAPGQRKPTPLPIPVIVKQLETTVGGEPITEVFAVKMGLDPATSLQDSIAALAPVSDNIASFEVVNVGGKQLILQQGGQTVLDKIKEINEAKLKLKGTPQEVRDGMAKLNNELAKLKRDVLGLLGLLSARGFYLPLEVTSDLLSNIGVMPDGKIMVLDFMNLTKIEPQISLRQAGVAGYVQSLYDANWRYNYHMARYRQRLARMRLTPTGASKLLQDMDISVNKGRIPRITELESANEAIEVLDKAGRTAEAAAYKQKNNNWVLLRDRAMINENLQAIERLKIDRVEQKLAINPTLVTDGDVVSLDEAVAALATADPAKARRGQDLKDELKIATKKPKDEKQDKLAKQIDSYIDYSISQRFYELIGLLGSSDDLSKNPNRFTLEDIRPILKAIGVSAPELLNLANRVRSGSVRSEVYNEQLEYTPISKQVRIGGDYVKEDSSENGRFTCLQVGDVSGHGLPSAIFAVFADRLADSFKYQFNGKDYKLTEAADAITKDSKLSKEQKDEAIASLMKAYYKHLNKGLARARNQFGFKLGMFLSINIVLVDHATRRVYDMRIGSTPCILIQDGFDRGINTTAVQAANANTVQELAAITGANNVGELLGAMSISSTDTRPIGEIKTAAELFANLKTMTVSQFTTKALGFMNRDSADRFGVAKDIFDKAVTGKSLAAMGPELFPLIRLAVLNNLLTTRKVVSSSIYGTGVVIGSYEASPVPSVHITENVRDVILYTDGVSELKDEQKNDILDRGDFTTMDYDVVAQLVPALLRAKVRGMSIRDVVAEILAMAKKQWDDTTVVKMAVGGAAVAPVATPVGAAASVPTALAPVAVAAGPVTAPSPAVTAKTVTLEDVKKAAMENGLPEAAVRNLDSIEKVKAVMDRAIRVTRNQARDLGIIVTDNLTLKELRKAIDDDHMNMNPAVNAKDIVDAFVAGNATITDLRSAFSSAWVEFATSPANRPVNYIPVVLDALKKCNDHLMKNPMGVEDVLNILFVEQMLLDEMAPLAPTEFLFRDVGATMVALQTDYSTRKATAAARITELRNTVKGLADAIKIGERLGINPLNLNTARIALGNQQELLKMRTEQARRAQEAATRAGATVIRGVPFGQARPALPALRMAAAAPSTVGIMEKGLSDALKAVEGPGRIDFAGFLDDVASFNQRALNGDLGKEVTLKDVIPMVKMELDLLKAILGKGLMREDDPAIQSARFSAISILDARWNELVTETAAIRAEIKKPSGQKSMTRQAIRVSVRNIREDGFGPLLAILKDHSGIRVPKGALEAFHSLDGIAVQTVAEKTVERKPQSQAVSGDVKADIMRRELGIDIITKGLTADQIKTNRERVEAALAATKDIGMADILKPEELDSIRNDPKTRQEYLSEMKRSGTDWSARTGQSIDNIDRNALEVAAAYYANKGKNEQFRSNIKSLLKAGIGSRMDAILFLARVDIVARGAGKVVAEAPIVKIAVEITADMKSKLDGWGIAVSDIPMVILREKSSEPMKLLMETISDARGRGVKAEYINYVLALYRDMPNVTPSSVSASINRARAGTELDAGWNVFTAVTGVKNVDLPDDVRASVNKEGLNSMRIMATAIKIAQRQMTPEAIMGIIQANQNKALPVICDAIVPATSKDEFNAALAAITASARLAAGMAVSVAEAKAKPLTPELDQENKKWEAMLKKAQWVIEDVVGGREKYEEDLVAAVQSPGTTQVGYLKIQNFKGEFNGRGYKLGIGSHELGDAALSAMGKTFPSELKKEAAKYGIAIEAYMRGPDFFIIAKNVTDRKLLERIVTEILGEKSQFRKNFMKQIQEDLRDFMPDVASYEKAIERLKADATFTDATFNMYGGFSNVLRQSVTSDRAVAIADQYNGQAARTGKDAQLRLAGEGKYAYELGNNNLASLLEEARVANKTNVMTYSPKETGGTVDQAATNLPHEYGGIYAPISDTYRSDNTFAALDKKFQKALEAENRVDAEAIRVRLAKKMARFAGKYIDSDRIIFNGKENMELFIDSLMTMKNPPEGRIVATFRTGGDEYGAVVWDGEKQDIYVLSVDGNNIGATTATLGREVADEIMARQMMIIDEILRRPAPGGDIGRLIRSIPREIRITFSNLNRENKLKTELDTSYPLITRSADFRAEKIKEAQDAGNPLKVHLLDFAGVRHECELRISPKKDGKFVVLGQEGRFEINVYEKGQPATERGPPQALVQVDEYRLRLEGLVLMGTPEHYDALKRKGRVEIKTGDLDTANVVTPIRSSTPMASIGFRKLNRKWMMGAQRIAKGLLNPADIGAGVAKSHYKMWEAGDRPDLPEDIREEALDIGKRAVLSKGMRLAVLGVPELQGEAAMRTFVDPFAPNDVDQVLFNSMLDMAQNSPFARAAEDARIKARVAEEAKVRARAPATPFGPGLVVPLTTPISGPAAAMTQAAPNNILDLPRADAEIDRRFGVRAAALRGGGMAQRFVAAGIRNAEFDGAANDILEKLDAAIKDASSRGVNIEAILFIIETNRAMNKPIAQTQDEISKLDAKDQIKEVENKFEEFMGKGNKWRYTGIELTTSNLDLSFRIIRAVTAVIYDMKQMMPERSVSSSQIGVIARNLRGEAPAKIKTEAEVIARIVEICATLASQSETADKASAAADRARAIARPILQPPTEEVQAAVPAGAGKVDAASKVCQGLSYINTPQMLSEPRLIFVPLNGYDALKGSYAPAQQEAKRILGKKFGMNIVVVFYDGTLRGLEEAYESPVVAAERIKPNSLELAYVPADLFDQVANSNLGKDKTFKFMKEQIPANQNVSELAMHIVLGIGLLDLARQEGKAEFTRYDASNLMKLFDMMTDNPECLVAIKGMDPQNLINVIFTGKFTFLPRLAKFDVKGLYQAIKAEIEIMRAL